MDDERCACGVGGGREGGEEEGEGGTEGGEEEGEGRVAMGQ